MLIESNEPKDNCHPVLPFPCFFSVRHLNQNLVVHLHFSQLYVCWCLQLFTQTGWQTSLVQVCRALGNQKPIFPDRKANIGLSFCQVIRSMTLNERKIGWQLGLSGEKKIYFFALSTPLLF